ncbi:hypothetical protein ACSBR2_002600 [Camellia fascicularis]
MLHCCMPSLSTRRPNLISSLPPPQQANSAEGTPRSSAQRSPTVNLIDEYTLATQSNSFSEIWSIIHPSDPSYENPDSGHTEADCAEQLLAQILNPSRECVQEALKHARPNTLTHLVSAYFDHSENTSHLCLILRDSVHNAHSLYCDLHKLLDVLPLDAESNSLSQPQCDTAFDVFLQFDCLDNPFPDPESHNFQDMRRCFSQLNQQLHRRLHKSRSRVRLLQSSLLPAFLPSKISKKELAHVAQLDAAARGTYVLHNDLDTIDRLVDRLYAGVEDDKLLIRLGLARGRDRHPIHEVAKQLQKNHRNFLSQLKDLEEHICLCVAAINRARSLLLDEIRLYQSHYS